MTKKTKARRGGPARRAAGSPGPGRPNPGGRAQARTTRTDADAAVGKVLATLWEAIRSGDPLRAEIETATCMAIPRVLGQLDPGDNEKFIATVLVDGAVRRDDPDGAALLRLLMSLGTPGTRRAASRALAELTGSGVYPPDWVTEVGKVTPGEAWRRYDVFGDDEAVAVTFGYGEDRHGIVVQVDLAGMPAASAVGVSSDGARLIEAIRGEHDPFERAEPISLAEARRRLAGPLDRADAEPDPDLSADTAAYLPIARSRARRLPEDAAPPAAFTAADRAAVVDEFMKSPEAAEAVAADEESTRFWAEVLTGYSSRLPGEPPAQVGPRKLTYIMLGHVPNTYVLSVAQREHAGTAVTAWARWSAGYRELGEDATTVLMDRVPGVLSRFGQAYDNPDAAAIRAYAAGLAASDSDVAVLSAAVARRMFALPIPPRNGQVDLGDPAGRRSLVQAEFADCTPPSGLTSEEFAGAACRVVEGLWRGEDDRLYQAARRLSAEGTDRHDIIHRLAAAQG